MSESKHTPGILRGETNINDIGSEHPRCTLGIGTKRLFHTTFVNSRLNANRMMKCWNSHDKLLEACKLIKERLLSHGEWDAGCFYYAGISASELEEPLKLLATAITEAEKTGD